MRRTGWREGLVRYDIRFRGVLATTDDPGVPPAPDAVEGFVDAVVAELEVLKAEDIDVSTD